MNLQHDFEVEANKVKIGTIITINAWGNFDTKTIECIGFEYSDWHKESLFVFDNGYKFSKLTLCQNLALWNNRNGYKIS